MKQFLCLLTLGAAALAAAGKPQTYTGVITDTMCGARHTMGVTPDGKCVRECVKMDPQTKYALLVGKDVYVLSDQQTPGKFAAQRVKVTGTLFPQTRTIQVARIEAAGAPSRHSGHSH